MGESPHRVRTWSVLTGVGKVTFLEIIRDRILYNVVFIALLLFVLTMLASKLWATLPERVLLDFGLAALSLTCSLVGVMTGAAQLSREIERRTIYMALSRPISRMQFMSGKVLGLLYLVTLNWALISGVFLILLYFMTQGTEAKVFTSTLFAALALSLMQTWMLTSMSVFFSTFSTTSLSAVMAIGVYSVGVNVSELRLAIAKFPAGFLKSVCNGIVALLPNLEHFNLGLRLTYMLPVGLVEFAVALAYAGFWIGLLVVGSGLAVRAKEI